jgi:hypothetical protein
MMYHQKIICNIEESAYMFVLCRIEHEDDLTLYKGVLLEKLTVVYLEPVRSLPNSQGSTAAALYSMPHHPVHILRPYFSFWLYSPL